MRCDSCLFLLERNNHFKYSRNKSSKKTKKNEKKVNNIHCNKKERKRKVFNLWELYLIFFANIPLIFHLLLTELYKFQLVSLDKKISYLYLACLECRNMLI